MKATPLWVIFDGDCPFCTACAAFLRLLDRMHRLRPVPFQALGVCRPLGLSPAECGEAAWAGCEGSPLVRGAEAIALALGTAIGAAGLAPLYRRPPVRRVMDAVYDWVARHRGRLPGFRRYCDRHPAECGRGMLPGHDVGEHDAS